MIMKQRQYEVIDIYSFNLEMIGKTIYDYEIKALIPDKKVNTDGWIISSTNDTDNFSLNGISPQKIEKKTP